MEGERGRIKKNSDKKRSTNSKTVRIIARLVRALQVPRTFQIIVCETEIVSCSYKLYLKGFRKGSAQTVSIVFFSHQVERGGVWWREGQKSVSCVKRVVPPKAGIGSCGDG